jgi:hypothetical protein
MKKTMIFPCARHLVARLVLTIGFGASVGPLALLGHDPAVRAIVDRAIEAVGGAAAQDAVQGLRVEIENEIPAMGIKMTGRMVQQRPDRFVVEVEVPGMGTTWQGYDGTVGWARDPIQGYREMAGAELEQLRNNARLDRFAALYSLYPTMEVQPDAEVEGRPAKVLRAVTVSGSEETWYFDATSGLPLAWDLVIDAGPSGKLPARTTFADWERIPGTKLMVPMTSRVANPAFQMVTRLGSIELNPEIDPAIFAPKR